MSFRRPGAIATAVEVRRGAGPQRSSSPGGGAQPVGHLRSLLLRALMLETQRLLRRGGGACL
eukprot:1401209-Lingulodinium_polyedra.AAC.1